MKIVQNAVLMLIAMIAGLALLSPLEPDRSASTGMPPSLSPTIAANSAHEKPLRQDSVSAVELESETSQPVVTSAAALELSQTAGWISQLYPELAIIAATESLPSDLALTELRPMLSSAEPVVRLAALESLADMRHPALLATLGVALDDPEPQVRIVALQALGRLDDPAAVASIEPCLFDHETDVRLAAIQALSNLEFEQAAQTLVSLLSDQNAKIRQQAVNALGEIGGEQSIAYLRQARFDPDADIRANAITILEELGDTAW